MPVQQDHATPPADTTPPSSIIHDSTPQKESESAPYLDSASHPLTATTTTTSTPSLQQQRRPWSLLSFLKRKLVLPNKAKHEKSSRSRARPSIRTIASSSPTGDVLDLAQQRDIMDKLLVSPDSNHIQGQPSSEAAMVAQLSFIWVFRLQGDGPLVWTGFDLSNQARLTEHYAQYRDTTADPGLELFDSHVRQGRLPLLVLPGRQLGYYPLDMTGDQIGTLQVACLPNTQDTQFVYREYTGLSFRVCRDVQNQLRRENKIIYAKEIR